MIKLNNEIFRFPRYDIIMHSDVFIYVVFSIFTSNADQTTLYLEFTKERKLPRIIFSRLFEIRFKYMQKFETQFIFLYSHGNGIKVYSFSNKNCNKFQALRTSGAPLYTLSKLYDVHVGFVSPSFDAVYCYICGRRVVDVARYTIFTI